ncbi:MULTISPECIES: MFS transporter [unclassified Streptomyces]|uniref:MFS transporter n=1 Tax=unclassified Streptomyces TaxID=2593676 RepID=UPI000DAC5FE1|nr:MULTISPECIES: MFS transporter [unclassified Streptomyces]PZT74846.1 MFS transporter [Streptomyces sp. AC1-42T]PZT82170.1 MFS transporter [Streptomyces sp. AC1-42W]
MTSVEPAAAGSGTSRRRPALVLALLALAQLITSLDYNIVYVALPEIGDSLDFSAQTLQWVVSAYAVVYGGFLLLGGRACDLLGRRRVFVFGLSLYAVGSLLGGLATSPGFLVASRAVQGLGGAFLFPATLSLVITSFTEGRERNRALAVWAGAGASGMVVGSLLGGVLTQAFGWESVFYVNVPLALAAIALAFPLLPADGARASGRSFDLPGALTGTAGATLTVFALVQGPESGWTSVPVLASVTTGIMLVAVFLFIESRSAEPLMPLRLFRNRNLSAGVATTFMFMATFGSLLYFQTVYFQNVLGYSALTTGLAFLVPMVTGLVGSTLGGRLATRFGTRNTILGSLVVGALGTLLLALQMTPSGSYAALVPGLVVLSLGQGALYTSMFAASSSGVDPMEQGIAAGLVSTGQQVGGAVGLALLVAVANSVTGTGAIGEASRAATADGLHTAVLIAAACIAASVAIALRFRRDGRRESGQGGPGTEPAADEPLVTESSAS